MKRMAPARAGVSPMIERTVVVLPMPLRPISVTISPGAICSDTPNSTLLRPYAVSMLSTSSRLSAMAGHRLLLAEIGAAHLRVGAHLGRRAAGDDAAIHQHGDTVGKRE